jgi:hypothetical protein
VRHLGRLFFRRASLNLILNLRPAQSLRNEAAPTLARLVYDFQFQEDAPSRVQPRQSFLPSSRQAFFLQLQQQFMRPNTEEVS